MLSSGNVQHQHQPLPPMQPGRPCLGSLTISMNGSVSQKQQNLWLMSRFILSAVQGKRTLCYFQLLPYHKRMPQRATLHVWFEFSVGALPDITSPSRTKQGIFYLNRVSDNRYSGFPDVLLVLLRTLQLETLLKHCCIFSLAQGTNKGVRRRPEEDQSRYHSDWSSSVVWVGPKRLCGFTQF